MSEVGRRYPARAYLAGSRPCHDLHPAAGYHQAPDPTDERQKLLSAAGRISAYAEALLGPPCLARGYFCGSSGNVTDEVIKAYIAPQSHDSDDVFRIEGEASPSGDTPLGDSSGEEPRPRLSPAGAGMVAASAASADFSRYSKPPPL